jgi:hypothetical protein
MDAEDHIWMLVTRKMANEATAKELAELDLLLKQNPIAHNSLNAIFDWWATGEEQVAANSSRLFEKILEQIKPADNTRAS